MLSDRIGHANTSVTLQIYTHHSAGRDQAMAQTLGEMIQAAIGSRLLQDASTGQDSVADASDAHSGDHLLVRLMCNGYAYSCRSQPLPSLRCTDRDK